MTRDKFRNGLHNSQKLKIHHGNPVGVPTKSSLRPFQDQLAHLLVRVAWHRPRIIFADDVFESITCHEHVIYEPDTFSQGNFVEAILKEGDIDVWIHERVSRLLRDKTRLRDWSHQVDNHRQPIPLIGNGEVPLKGIWKQGL